MRSRVLFAPRYNDGVATQAEGHDDVVPSAAEKRPALQLEARQAPRPFEWTLFLKVLKSFMAVSQSSPKVRESPSARGRGMAASRRAMPRVSSPDASGRPMRTISPTRIAPNEGDARARRLVARRRSTNWPPYRTVYRSTCRKKLAFGALLLSLASSTFPLPYIPLCTCVLPAPHLTLRSATRRFRFTFCRVRFGLTSGVRDLAQARTRCWGLRIPVTIWCQQGVGSVVSVMSACVHLHSLSCLHCAVVRRPGVREMGRRVRSWEGEILHR